MRKWTPSRAAVPALIALLGADSLYTAWTWLCWNRRPGPLQDVWLRYALALREGGDLPLGNDLPLYPAALALWVRRTSEAFTWSKLFSLAVGAATLAATYRVGKKLFGRGPALLAASALSVDWIFLALGMSLRAEVLLPPLFLLAWFAAWEGFEDERNAALWWLASGAIAGLATLAKGTGPIFAAAWGLGLAAAASRKPRRLRAALGYIAGFAPLAAVLWWANRSLFGEGGRHFSIQHAVWLDSWWELDAKSYADLTFSAYLRSHGWSAIFRREALGALRFAPVAASCLSPAEAFPFERLLRWPALALALWAVWDRRRTALEALRRKDGAAWMTAALLGSFYLLFAWYHQVSPSERFVGPLAPIVLLLLSAVVWQSLASRAWVRRAAGRYGVPAAAGAAILVLAALGLKLKDWGIQDPFRGDRLEPGYQRAVDWASERRGTVVFGPSDELPSYLLPPEVRPLALPERGAAGGFDDWLRSSGAHSAVIDGAMASMPFLRGFFEASGDGGLRIERLPEGWRLAGTDGESPPNVLFLEKAGS